MTGDGVNDILAMRESDCSIAMIAGSDAARAACDFVLMSDNFGAMVDVLKEGRRVINNIEKVAAVFLLQTVYSLLLTIIYIILDEFQYPVTLRQMMPVGSLTVGIPTFFLALQANYSKPSDKLVQNMIEHTLPAAITIVFNTLYIQVAAVLFDIPFEEYSTMVVFLIGIVGFYLLMKVSLPYTDQIKVMLVILAISFIITFTVTPIREFFFLSTLFNRNAFFYLPLIYFSYHVHDFFGKACKKSLEAYRILKSAGWMKSR
jgi:cation-transporting ATPase E